MPVYQNATPPIALSSGAAGFSLKINFPLLPPGFLLLGFVAAEEKKPEGANQHDAEILMLLAVIQFAQQH
jgi:hypothetical protein